MKMLFNLTAPEGELEASWVGVGRARRCDGETDIHWRRLDQPASPLWQSDWHEGRAREYRAVSVQQHRVLGAPDD